MFHVKHQKKNEVPHYTDLSLNLLPTPKYAPKSRQGLYPKGSKLFFLKEKKF